MLLVRAPEKGAETVSVLTFYAEAKQRTIEGLAYSVQEKFRQAKRWAG